MPDAIVLKPKLLTFHWRKIADDRRGRHCTLLIAGIAHTACTFFAEIEELRRRSVESAESTHIDWLFFLPCVEYALHTNFEFEIEERN